MNLNIKRLL